MTDRINQLVSLVLDGNVLADIGCDHGYCSYLLAKRNTFSKIIMADKSELCLNKARKLLSSYNGKTKIESVVSNGFDNIIDNVDVAIIAGMGGEEIIAILKKAKFLPNNLVLQPMKNADKVRVFLMENGYKFTKDFIKICDGKFYDFMTLTKGKQSLTEEEILFGVDNVKLKNKDFIEKINKERNNIISLLENCELNKEVKKEKLEYLNRTEKYVKG